VAAATAFEEDQMDKEHTEYRVRAVTRFIVTKAEWVVHENGTESGSTARQLGPEYPNEDMAYEVGYALARQESERMGCSPFDDRVIYPMRPSDELAQAAEAQLVA
jgi:hypothetical protein